ncbi:cell division protein FtsQ/DivIB [Constantimarinum furrinae]|uniref:Cell division protein FtsQ n=1 Tax=Constantimarinum furrinae TaxID=2562285 RepID=A0A7G8PRG5_9FLAO|nr:cell division protein FtsQ/DivIB [Constantimarinum furrinae]QNJ96931.1 Cell division protein FtsQ [Constantimarinum furrinae]
MKINWRLIKFVILIGLIGFLFSFSKQRNNNRNLKKISIEFLDDNDPFITLDAVNKLLIQNNDSVTSIGKETLVLNEMEHRLLKNPMIRDAEVFVTVDGVLGAKIEQRKPIARVSASPDYYLDDEGKKMPLSTVYTARVPLITGKSDTNFTEVTPILLKINEDDFMKKSVVGLHLGNNGKVELRIRKHDFKVILGTAEAIEKKFQNFKAFYKKAKSDKILAEYGVVNLEFGDQVVATKK